MFFTKHLPELILVSCLFPVCFKHFPKLFHVCFLFLHPQIWPCRSILERGGQQHWRTASEKETWPTGHSSPRCLLIWCCNQTQGIDYQSVQRQGESANLLQPRSRQAAWVAAGMDVIMCPVQVWGVGLVWCVSCSHEFVYIISLYIYMYNMFRHGLWPLVACFTSTIICIIHKYG